MRILPALALSLGIVAPVCAQCWEEHVVAGVTDTRLSSGLALGPGIVAFGQPRFDPAQSPLVEDVVRVFEQGAGGFVEVATFTSSLPGPTAASFGLELDLDGAWLAVGDPGAGASVPAASGAVHLYRRTHGGWLLQQVLQPALGQQPFLFGFGAAFDLEGDTLAVGVPQAASSAATFEDGLVIVFLRTGNTWSEVQRIAHPQPALAAGFGRAVALDGRRLLVGSPGDASASGLGAAGAAFLFDGKTGTFVHAATLLAQNPLAGAGLGASVALEGAVAAVGATGEEVNNQFAAGRAHVFEKAQGAWSEVAVLEEPPVRPYHRFGDDVELESGRLYVTSAGAGTARRFERAAAGAWLSAHRYTTVSGFAWPTGLPARVRALGSRIALTDPEGATVFPLDPPATGEVGCPGLPLASGQPGVPASPVFLDVRGEQRLSEPTLDFLVATGRPIGAGILLYGFAPNNVPLGSGALCISAPIVRTAVGAPVAIGSTLVTLDLAGPPVGSGPKAIAPGVTVHLQYWFRVPGVGSHLTNSLRATFCP